jgi:tRNA threonylcarbamoyladenosine biosynthesis protein TsaB
MLLALDTATRLISLALHDGQTLLAESTWQSANTHTLELAPQVALLLRRAGLEAARLRGVAVALGPGSYTGLRIGLGFAKGLALAQGLALLGVGTYEALLRAQPPRAEPVVAVLQAGRGRVLAARYQWQAKPRQWQMLAEPHIYTWAGLAESIQTPSYVCGEIDAAGAAQLRARRGLVTLASPAQSLRRAGYLAEIGWERLRATGGANPEAASRLAPIYASSPAGSMPEPAPSAGSAAENPPLPTP